VSSRAASGFVAVRRGATRRSPVSCEISGGSSPWNGALGRTPGADTLAGSRFRAGAGRGRDGPVAGDALAPRRRTHRDDGSSGLTARPRTLLTCRGGVLRCVIDPSLGSRRGGRRCGGCRVSGLGRLDCGNPRYGRSLRRGRRLRRRRRGRRLRRRGGSSRSRLLGGRRRRGCRLRSGRGRRRGRRGRVGYAPWRKQCEWVDVRLALADPNAEMEIRNLVLDLAARSWIGDGISLRDRCALANAQRSEMGERRLVAVGRRDRHREAVRRNLPGERHLARRRSAHRTRPAHGDVNPSMLTCRVLVAPDRELPEDRAVGGPPPGPGRRAVPEGPDEQD